MEPLHIAIFAVRALDEYDYLSTEIVQKYIRDDESTAGAIVPVETINEVLDLMVLDKWLDYIDGSIDGICFYQRYTPQRKKKVYIQ